MPPVHAEHPPLSAADLRHALIRPGGLWRDVEVVSETGSTNSDLLRAAKAGAPEGAVLAAETQTAGRGRMGRRWHSQPRTALMFSVLLRPTGVPPGNWGWVPLLAGVAAASALRRVATVDAVLKWPNDVLVGHRKLAGILAEQAGEAIVAGMGINVAAVPEGPDGAGATSVESERADRISRKDLLVAVLGELEDRYRRWTADPQASWLRQEYRRLCDTIGRRARVTLPGGRVVTAAATDVDGYGRLVLESAGIVTVVSAGDVVHVR